MRFLYAILFGEIAGLVAILLGWGFVFIGYLLVLFSWGTVHNAYQRTSDLFPVFLVITIGAGLFTGYRSGANLFKARWGSKVQVVLVLLLIAVAGGLLWHFHSPLPTPWV